ncbi:MAG: ATP phosphoribosyltransferase regulatory subunit, partial [Nocardioidaceae bacterium]
MSRPTPVSGFPELLPAQRTVEQHVLDELRRVFELHGFTSVETRAVEPLDQLVRTDDMDKEIYVLRRLHAGEADDAGPELAGLGLHFDLTVPFARYVLENAGRLEFPFRRYQVQRCWRGERPQEGRFREFTQADIDVVGRDELPFHHDVEVAQVMAEGLAALRFLPPLRLQVNNRKLIEGFYRGIGAPDPGAVMRVVDKLDKLRPDQVETMLADQAGLGDAQIKQCLALADIQTPDASFVDRVGELGVSDDLLDQGRQELAEVMDGTRAMSTERLTV